MTVPTLLQVLRDRWRYLLIGLLVGALTALAVGMLTPRAYASTSSLYVSAFDDSRSATSAYQGSLLSQQRVKSYTELLVSARVLTPVIDDLDLSTTPEELTKQIAIGSSAESTVLTVTVTDGDPDEAARIANSVAERFTGVVAELERPNPDTDPAVVVNVVDPAVPDPVAVRPRPGVDILVGLLVGLVAAVAAVLIRGSLDTRVRTAAELAKIAEAPSMGTVPASPALSAGAAVAPSDRLYGEAIRRIRTNLMFAGESRPLRTVVVTSSTASEGKTALVCTLAGAMAATGRVLIVESDMRRPTIAARLGLRESTGLADVLAGRLDPKAAIQSWGAIDVLVCGYPPADPSELLSSPLFGKVLDGLAAEYGTVLLDAPPLGPVADAAILAGRADGALLLCRSGVTTHAQVRASVDALQVVGARICGSVLTMTAREREQQHGGYYGYPSRPGSHARVTAS